MNHIQMLSPAKVNLYLDVVGRRSDGYHLIETVFQAVDLSDLISIKKTESPGIELICSHREVPADSGNLIYRAAELFFQESHIKSGVKIKLEKKIPVAAGLGGGSSNAATTLKALSQLFDIPINISKLFPLALKLGADVPFFLNHQVALGRGIGEELKEIPSQCNFWVLLVNPGFPVKTKSVYQSIVWPLTPHHGDTKIMEFALRQGDIKLLCQNLYNRLELVVLDQYQKIVELKNMLIKLGSRGVLLSGSGPTLLAIFESEDEALEVKTQFNKVHNFWTTVCRNL